MLVARLLDGISDIMMGGIVDKTRTKWEKARPWILMLAGFLIVAINPYSGTFAIVGTVVRGFGNDAIFACGFALSA